MFGKFVRLYINLRILPHALIPKVVINVFCNYRTNHTEISQHLEDNYVGMHNRVGSSLEQSSRTYLIIINRISFDLIWRTLHMTCPQQMRYATCSHAYTSMSIFEVTTGKHHVFTDLHFIRYAIMITNFENTSVTAPDLVCKINLSP